MPREKVRLTMVVSPEVRKLLQDYAAGMGVSVDEVVDRFVRLIGIYQQQRTVGRKHLGFVADPTKLDAEVIGLR